MSVTKLYHVSVHMPESLWYISNTPPYQQAVLAATAESIAAGSDSYNGLEEWAEYYTLEEAERCEQALLNIASRLMK